MLAGDFQNGNPAYLFYKERSNVINNASQYSTYGDR